VSEKVGVGVGVAVAIPVAVAIRVGLINVGVGVNVLVSGRIVGVDVSAGVDAYAVGVAVAVSVGWSATTLGGVSTTINKRLITPVPMKRLSDRYEVLARIKALLIPTINFRKGESPNE